MSLEVIHTRKSIDIAIQSVSCSGRYMEIIDISWPISEQMTRYKNKSVIQLQTIKTFDHDKVRQTSILMDSHTGTHVEAQAHFMHDGITTDKIGLQQYCGRCSVIDMTFVGDSITDEHLSLVHIEPNSILLFKTTNSELEDNAPFDSNYVYLSESGAAYLSEKQVNAVGIDYLGIERSQEAHITHRTLMENNIVIIEGLRLRKVHAGNYFFICLPLAFVGIEAAPARAILFEDF